MKPYKLAIVSVVFVLAVSLAASASSNNNFSNVSLTGVSGTVSGSFSFNNGKFSGLSLTFNGGVFDKLGASSSGGNGTCVLSLCGYTWQTQLKNGVTIWETIVFNIKTGQFQDYGGIYNWKNQGGFNYMSVPEGGTELSYLMLAAFAIFAGLLISRKRRRGSPVARLA